MVANLDLCDAGADAGLQVLQVLKSSSRIRELVSSHVRPSVRPNVRPNGPSTSIDSYLSMAQTFPGAFHGLWVSLVLFHEFPSILAGQFPPVCEQPVLFCNHRLARRLSSD